jgi:hypothetical protein
MYLANRFARSALWWPTAGEDVHVEDLGNLPGKALLLELKVPEEGTPTHTLTIGIPQLRTYVNGRRTRGIPTYYAYPWPPWAGDLHASGWLGTQRRADIAYLRTNEQWFGHWTSVCPAESLLAHLAPKAGQQTAVLSTDPADALGWRDFWTAQSNCGNQALPAIFLVPPNSDLGATTTREELRAQLARVRSEFAVLKKADERNLYLEKLRETPLDAFVPAQEPGAYRSVSRSQLNEDLAAWREEASVSGTATAGSAGSDYENLAVCSLPFGHLG